MKATSVDFREITTDGGRKNAERLFKATVSAYCSITRPTRNDVYQLEEIVMPLVDKTSAESRRFAAAALSETSLVPKRLALRLCDEKAEICAPLLLRVTSFSEGDLVTLIARHGVPHAKLVARRKTLAPIVKDLLFALGDESLNDILNGRDRKAQTKPVAPAPKLSSKDGIKPGQRESAVRETLRDMMRVAEEEIVQERQNERYLERLTKNVFSDNPAFFQTSLADILNINFPLARSITESPNWDRLAIALKSLGIGGSDAYLLTSACFPSAFSDRANIASFLDHYKMLDQEAAIDRIHAWKVGAFTDIMAQKSGPLSDRSKSAKNGTSKTASGSGFRKAS